MRGTDALGFVQELDRSLASADVQQKSVRLSVVKKIDAQADSIADQDMREQFRRQAQREWNRMHPDARILEWGKDDSAYRRDTEEGVVLYPRPGCGRRSCGVLEKSTGADLTDEIHHVDFELRVALRELMLFEEPLNARNDEELAQYRFQAFQDWLAIKRMESDAYKYHKGAEGFDIKTHHIVWQEFLEETRYRDPILPLKATEEEKATLQQLRDAYDQAQATRRSLNERYQIAEEEYSALRYPYRDTHSPGFPETDPLTGKTLDGNEIYIDITEPLVTRRTRAIAAWEQEAGTPGTH